MGAIHARPARARVVTGLAIAAIASAGAIARQDQIDAAPEAAPSVEDFMPDQESWAGGDVAKHYYLMGPRPDDERPADGFALVVILPGGDGGAGFHPWCRTIVERALPVGCVGAQLVAPVFGADPNRVVWPTRMNNPDKARFTTEDFVLEVIAEARARLPIDERRIFVLGWSSGGPPAYAVTLLEKSPVAGAFVAMSVFKPELLPPLAGAAGKSFFLLHSPQDFIPLDRHAAVAAEQLAAAGAAAKLDTSNGGHGWRDDAPARIGRGLQWLLEQNP